MYFQKYVFTQTNPCCYKALMFYIFDKQLKIEMETQAMIKKVFDISWQDS